MKKNKKKGYSAIEASVVAGVILLLGFTVMGNYKTSATALGDKSTDVMESITNSDILNVPAKS